MLKEKGSYSRQCSHRPIKLSFTGITEEGNLRDISWIKINWISEPLQFTDIE